MTDPQEHRQDLNLARRAALGEERAWQEIYEGTCQQLFNLLCFQVGDRDVAKDLMAETYLTALHKMDRYRGEGSLLGWLRTIALRRCLDWRRTFWRRMKKLKLMAAEQANLPGDSGRPDDAQLDVQSATFRNALKQLSANQRAALILHELEGLSFQEIAATLGCGEATARVHCHRARERMRNLLAAGMGRGLADEMGGQQA